MYCATKAMLLSHSRIDTFTPRTLNLLSVTQFLDQSSRLKPDRAVGDQDSDWQYRVSLCLNGYVSCVEIRSFYYPLMMMMMMCNDLMCTWKLTRSQLSLAHNGNVKTDMSEKNEKHLESMESVRWVEREEHGGKVLWKKTSYEPRVEERRSNEHVYSSNRTVRQTERQSTCIYTVFQKKWCQNWNHYHYGTPYQN